MMYELKGHLGNVRVVVSDSRLGVEGFTYLSGELGFKLAGNTDNVDILANGTLTNTSTTAGWQHVY